LLADLAQLVERVLGKDEVTGSNPVVGSGQGKYPKPIPKKEFYIFSCRAPAKISAKNIYKKLCGFIFLIPLRPEKIKLVTKPSKNNRHG
jgi:hypothetical protein